MRGGRGGKRSATPLCLARPKAKAEGDDLNVPYSYAERDMYEPAKEEITVSGPEFRHRFPPHSFTQIVVGLSSD